MCVLQAEVKAVCVLQAEAKAVCVLQAEGWRRARELPRRQVAASRLLLTPATTQVPALLVVASTLLQQARKPSKAGLVVTKVARVTKVACEVQSRQVAVRVEALVLSQPVTQRQVCNMQL